MDNFSPLFSALYDRNLKQIKIESKRASSIDLKDGLQTAIRLAAMDVDFKMWNWCFKSVEIISAHCEIPKIIINYSTNTGILNFGNLEIKFESDMLDDYRGEVGVFDPENFKNKLLNIFRKQKVKRLNE